MVCLNLEHKDTTLIAQDNKYVLYVMAPGPDTTVQSMSNKFSFFIIRLIFTSFAARMSVWREDFSNE